MAERKGRQEPTTSVVLPYTKTDGDIAIRLYEMSGRISHPWQQALVFDILAKNEDGLWTHTKFGYEVPRQNGKGEVILIRELYGLARGERIIHTAHLVSTAHSAFEKMCKLLDDIGLDRKKDYSSIKAKGQEQIKLKEGGIIEFRTRTATGALGESFDLLVIDEAQEYQTVHKTALQYVIAASKNPQTIKCGTPPTEVSSGTVFKDYRNDCLHGAREHCGWAEWSVTEISDINDKELWYECNPSLGYTLHERTVADEIDTSESGRIDFNIQRLGLWLKYDLKSAISRSAWDAVKLTTLPKMTDKVGVGIKFNKNGMSVSMALACKTEDGQIYVEVIGRGHVRDGTEWIIDKLRRLNLRLVGISIDGMNGAEILKDEIKKAKIRKIPIIVKAGDVIEASQRFEDGIYKKTLCHMEQPSLSAVVAKCEHRAIGSGGGFGYNPIVADMDISLLDSVVLAHWTVATVKDVQQKVTY